MTVIVLILIFALMTSCFADSDKAVDVRLPPACSVFCDGPILTTVQNSKIFEDDKTFVDMKMKLPIKEVNKLFNDMMDGCNRKPTKIMVRRFVRRCFSPIENDVIRHRPSDWVETPKLLRLITDRPLQNWASNLNALWKRMVRKVKPEVRSNPDSYSSVYLPYPVIVPGGRYREYYYWDSYWTILGLLRSEMYDTVKGMLKNFIILVEKYGFVPNGGRIYYLRRSNLPLLLPMFKVYHDFTNDTAFIRNSINVLEKEFEFWMTKRVVKLENNNETLKLNRFYVDKDGPRPEAYTSDILAAEPVNSIKGKSDLYLQLQTACESGWMFSSRWFVGNASDKGQITDTKTQNIVPVDLNAVICWNAKILSHFYRLLNNTEKHTTYQKIFMEWKESIFKLLWDETDGVWYDLDISSMTKRKTYYASNLTPLWTQCYDVSNSEEIGTKVTRYLHNSGALKYDGGVPTSLINSGNQWDFPNAYPPLQYIIIVGLKNCGNLEARELASRLAYQWIRSNFRGYILTNIMYAVYDTKEIGKPGIDTFKPDKSGYGWTNGVCLDLLYHYGRGIHTRGLNSALLRQLSTKTVLIICLINNLI